MNNGPVFTTGSKVRGCLLGMPSENSDTFKENGHGERNVMEI